jgi:outer membrane immunogenic protein
MRHRSSTGFGWFFSVAIALAAGIGHPSAASAQVSGSAEAPRPLPAIVAVTPETVRPSQAKSPAAGSPHWAGVYFGGLAGGASGRADAATTTVRDGYFADSSVPAIAVSGMHSLRPHKPAFGGEAGFNTQIAIAIVGVEGDFNVQKLNASQFTTAEYPCCAPETFTITQSVKTSWMFSMRGRAGVAIGSAWVFGTAGLAMTDFDYEARFSDTYANTHESGGIADTQTALVVGGGVEVKGGAHWSIKGEYLHADFGTFSTTSANLTAYTPPIAFPRSVFTHTTSFRLDVVRVGLNVGF